MGRAKALPKLYCEPVETMCNARGKPPVIGEWMLIGGGKERVGT